MQFSISLLVLGAVAPLLSGASPVGQLSEINKRVIPGCKVHQEWIGDWSEAGLSRKRTKFTTELVNPKDICRYFNCLGMSNQQCWWDEGLGGQIVDGSFAFGAGHGTYLGCLANAMDQWARDNGCEIV
ncbi:hypothetical protein BDV95DRAFT_600996 [Massariosphaeria phaeospora]|uniref:Uncharacterized protein n=1 Tax=Massariosphaeria phaeospora TaxID=100035 RepID=A0A7C8MHD3_9PLEO|nr:hypothetical protein BDV95DRAFT_600996 [Massariosphaeria phaeospora]